MYLCILVVSQVNWLVYEKTYNNVLAPVCLHVAYITQAKLTFMHIYRQFWISLLRMSSDSNSKLH